MSDYINKAQAVAQTIAEIESLGLEVGRGLEQRIKNDYISHPTADVAEVVRCKECKYRYLSGVGKQYFVCDFLDAENKDDGFCNYGERKEK